MDVENCKEVDTGKNNLNYSYALILTFNITCRCVISSQKMIQ